MFRKLMQEACKQLIPNHSQWTAQKELSESGPSLFLFSCLWLTLDNFPPPLNMMLLLYTCWYCHRSPAIFPWHKAVLWVWNKKTLSLSFWGFVGLNATALAQEWTFFLASARCICEYQASELQMGKIRKEVRKPVWYYSNSRSMLMKTK